jgi:hypothetical protein
MDAPPRPSQVSPWKPLLIATFVAGLLVAGAAFLYRDVTGTVEDAVEDARSRGDLTKSQANVRALVVLHMDAMLNDRVPTVGGRAFVLWPLVAGTISPDAPGSLEVFFSPADRGALERALTRRDAFRALTEERLRSGADLRQLTSYVGRGLEPADRARDRAGGAVPWIADLHFPGGVLVGFADGNVKWLTRADLGLGPSDPIVAGPASRSPLLRQLAE